MHLSTFTIILGAIVALAGTNAQPLDLKSDDLKNIDPATANLINDNGLVTLIPYFDIVQPAGTAKVVPSSTDDLNNPGERRIYYDGNNKFLRQVDIYRSDVRNLIKNINFVEPDPTGSGGNRTATIKADNTIRKDIEKLYIKLFDGREERVDFDYSTIRGNLEKITVHRLWNKDDYTEVKIDYNIFNKIEKVSESQTAVISQF
ncbi:hypothetical protein BDF22DRAFT_653712 [Syncephalis plumigaleata]|nr:hypothetical protein BDF22DRAFT_653712 [Syncephalis plumigaleata]